MQLLEAYFFLVAQESSKVRNIYINCNCMCESKIFIIKYFTQIGVRVTILSSLFWSKFEDKGYQAIKKWIEKVWLTVPTSFV